MTNLYPQMRKIGDIELPLQRTHKIPGGDIKILDYLFDMDIPKLSSVLAEIHRMDEPVLMVIRVGKLGFVGLVMYRPPDIWLDFDHQKYQLYISPSLSLLIHYFIERRIKVTDLFESQLLTKIINYLDHYQKNQRVSTT